MCLNMFWIIIRIIQGENGGFLGFRISKNPVKIPGIQWESREYNGNPGNIGSWEYEIRRFPLERKTSLLYSSIVFDFTSSLSLIRINRTFDRGSHSSWGKNLLCVNRVLFAICIFFFSFLYYLLFHSFVWDKIAILLVFTEKNTTNTNRNGFTVGSIWILVDY